MLQPIFYNKIAELIDEHLEKHYIPFINSRCAQHKVNYKLWVELDSEQKAEIIEFVEKEMANSIAKKMMTKAERIPFPAVGIFMYSHFKEYKKTHQREEDESIKDYYDRIIEYARAHRYRPQRMRRDEAQQSFAENLAKRKKHLL